MIVRYYSIPAYDEPGPLGERCPVGVKGQNRDNRLFTFCVETLRRHRLGGLPRAWKHGDDKNERYGFHKATSTQNDSRFVTIQRGESLA